MTDIESLANTYHDMKYEIYSGVWCNYSGREITDELISEISDYIKENVDEWIRYNPALLYYIAKERESKVYFEFSFINRIVDITYEIEVEGA